MESASGQCSPVPKMERRVIEKNRRNHMKTLCSKLYSLLPNHDSKEAVTLPDQIDEAVKYIKSLQMKLEKSKEKKENLSASARKRCHTCTIDSIGSLKSPKIEISEMGQALHVVFVTGQEDMFTFHEIIRMIQDEGAEFVNANFSVTGNSVFHAVHAKVGELAPNFVAARVSNRLKEFVNGSIGEVKSQPGESYEFEIQPDLWELDIPQVLLSTRESV